MRSRRLVRALSGCLLLLATVPGCQLFYQYRPVPVLVRDAETRKPITSADVHISYPLSTPEQSPWESSGITGADGIARLRAAPYGLAGLLVETTAPGYMSEQKPVTVDAVKAIKRGGLFESTDRRPPSLVIDLYAEPSPSIELIVPTGYRGTVKAEVQTDGAATFPAGQRNFSFPVTDSGVVQIVGSPLLRRVPAVTFRARYADGTPLGRHVQDPQVGFWWLRTEGNAHYYLVGTHTEYEVAGHFGHSDDNDAESSGEKKSQGKGRRGGGGGGRSGGQSSSGGSSSGD
jgi:uncharacterized membrane protein YgcG